MKPFSIFRVSMSKYERLKTIMISILLSVILSIQFLPATASGTTDTTVLNTSADEYEEKLNRGVDAFYRTDWQTANQIFEQLKKDSPQDPLPHFFLSMMPFWEYFFITQTEDLAEDFLKKSEPAVQLSLDKLEKSPDDTTTVLMLSGLYGYRSLVAAGESNYRVAIQSGLTGFNYTRKLLSLGTNRPDARIGRGMFYYMVGSIPREMRWATNMVGIRGDIEMGFDELKKAAESDSYVSNDAKMMLMFLYDKEKRFSEAIEYADDLTEKFPENVIFKFKKAQILENAGNKEQAASLYTEIIDQNHPDLREVTRISRDRILELN
jgi:tetratricopeptide (TPR) repeat protein